MSTNISDTKDDRLPTKREFSAGGMVYKKAIGDKQQVSILWLLGKHSGYHKWVLPKGMIERGEKARETAVRETQEEMGVVARIVGEKPVHVEEYWFVANLKSDKQKAINDKPVRRVKTYQEDPNFEEAGEKVRVFKTVKFFLMEYVSGDPHDHDWEMEDAGWFEYEGAMELLAFEGEKRALSMAYDLVAK